MIEALRANMSAGRGVAELAEGLLDVARGTDSLEAYAAARVVADTLLCWRRSMGIKV